MLLLRVLNLKFFLKKKLKNTPTLKYVFFAILIVIACSFINAKHPFYLSVVDILYKPQEHSLQLSVKMFTNDLEDALKQTSRKKIDILNPKNKTEIDSILFHYIKNRLSIHLDSKKQELRYLGYEKEEGTIWTYLEVTKVKQPHKINVDSKLLYDFLPQQSNIIHIEINEIKKSKKINNPESKVDFLF